MFKKWKGIEKRFQKMKVKEEEKNRKKAKKDAVDDQGKGNDGDKWKKDDGKDKGKKGDGDKRKRKDDDYIAGEELEEQIRAEADREWRQEQIRAEADRERRQEQIRVEVDRERSGEVPVDTLEYVEDEDEGDTEVNDNDNDAVDEEVDNKNADQEIYDVVGNDNEEREEKKSFNFEEDMKTLCKWLESSHAHRAEEALRRDRLIRPFREKKKWLNWRAEKEAEWKEAMARKFDEELHLRFQEEAKKQRLKVAQELRKEEERKLEELVKQLSVEHGVAEEDIQLQMQAVQDIVKAEVEKKVEKERMEEEKRRSEQMAREREEAE